MARFEVKVLPSAVADAQNQYAYFVERGEQKVADYFAERVREGIADLEETALQYQVVSAPLRRYPLKQFQHGIFYIVEGNLVVVDSVAHPKQSPEFWRSRRKG